MNEELNGVSITDIKAIVNKNFIDIFTESPDQYQIYGKSIADWKKYFSYPPINPDDPRQVRKALLESSNMFEECSDIISELKIAINRLDLDVFLTEHKTKERGYALKKKFTDIERATSMNTFKMNAIKKLANIFIKPFEESQNNLKIRISSYKSALASIANQMNNLGSTGIEE